jgi:hypothetical protein
VFLLGVAVAWLTPVAQAQEAHPIVLLAKKMAQPVDFPGAQNAELSLREALEFLTQKFGVHFDVNQRAFEMEGPGAAALAPREDGDDIFLVAAQDKQVGASKPGPEKPIPANKPIPGDKPAPTTKLPPVAPQGGANAPSVMDTPLNAIPKMSRVPLETVLKKILARTPTPTGMPPDYVLRRDGIEITTTRAKIAEFYRTTNHPGAAPGLMDEGPADDHFRFLPLVQVEFKKSRLEDALKNLADVTDHSILLDPRAADKAQIVTVTLINIPLDTAVELVANIAGLKVVMRDRALYVTTKDNADAMQKELQDRTPPHPALNPGLGMGGIGVLGGGLGGIPPGFGALPLVPPGAGQLPAAAPPKTGSPDLAQMQAEIAALRAELARLRQLKGESK